MNLNLVKKLRCRRKIKLKFKTKLNSSFYLNLFGLGLILVFSFLIFSNFNLGNFDISVSAESLEPIFLQTENKKIDFTYTDDNSNESLIIKTNGKSYIGLTRTDVYFSVTNIGDEPELVNLQVYFPEDYGEVEKIEKYTENQWHELEFSDNSISDTQNFFEKIFNPKIEKKSIPQNFKVKKSTDGQDCEIASGQTQYFKMEINFPPNSSGEFYIEAIGDKNGYGLLDPWWNSNWDCKKAITVTYSGSTLSNFQILVTTDTQTLISNSKMQSDCGDIRMIDSGEGVGDELDYWIESDTCNTTSTRIWVEVDSIPNGGKTIYMYYRKSDAANASSGTNTFVYFNDFETAVGFDAGALNPTRTTDSHKYDTYGIYGAGAGAYRQETRNNINSGRDLIWETWVRGKDTSSNCSLSGIGIGHPHAGTDKNGYQAYIDERNVVGIRENFNSSGLKCSDSVTINWNTWYFMSFYWTSSNTFGMSVYTDPASSPIGGCSGSDSTYTNGEYGVAAYKNADWDDYRVRKYTATEPTTSVGDEIGFSNVIVTDFGSQTSSLNVPSTNQYIGGGFSLADNNGSRNITGITITEHGTVNAQTNLANIKLYYDLDTSSPYDCVSESYGGSESQFGSASSSFSGADGTANFVGSVGISTTQTMCVYTVLDVGSGASNNQTLEIKINNPSTEVTVSSGTVEPSSAVEISGATTLRTPPDLQQIHYRWRNDDAGESIPWWDSNWRYRKKVTISSGTGAGANYQVELKVGESSGSSLYDFHIENHIESDFDDLRFVDDDDSTQLDYWIQEITGTSPNQTATVWVEVKDNLDSNQDIYCYYGYSSATKGSNGSNTFIFFDDFSDGNDDGWTEHNGNWSVVDFDGSYRYYQSDNTGTYLRTSNGTSSWTDYIVETKIRIVTGGGTGGFAGVLTRFQNTDNHYAVILDDRSDDSVWIRHWVSGSGSGSEWADVSINRDTWYNLRVDVFDEGANDKIKVFFGGITHERTYTDYATGKIALMMHGTQAYYDDIRVRKYASSEPDYFSVDPQDAPQAGATWAANEDTELTGLAKNTIRRLRLEISNEGGQTSSGAVYRLEVSEANPSSCAAGSYERVSTDADWEIAGSSYITDGEATYDISPGLTNANDDFVSGELKDTGDQTSGITLAGTTEFTEIEYSIKATTNATGGGNYCFRLTNAGSTNYFTYTKYAEAMVAGTLTVDIVDATGDPVANPSISMSGQTFSFNYQTSTGTFGISTEKIRVDNGTTNSAWALTIAATNGATTTWSNAGETEKYDFNDPTANAEDGADDDSYGGQMTINPLGATITPKSGCLNTDLNLGSSASFSEGPTNNITLLTAGSLAETSCYWDLTNVNISQTIPASQSVDTYILDFTLTIAAQ